MGSKNQSSFKKLQRNKQTKGTIRIGICQEYDFLIMQSSAVRAFIWIFSLSRIGLSFELFTFVAISATT